MKPLSHFNRLYTYGVVLALVAGVTAVAIAAEVDPTKPAVTASGVSNSRNVVAGELALQSIFKRAGGKTAVISGKSYRQGDSVGEFTILKINAKDVVISDGREQQTLKLYTYEIKK